jgi:hypothetical protein
MLGGIGVGTVGAALGSEPCLFTLCEGDIILDEVVEGSNVKRITVAPSVALVIASDDGKAAGVEVEGDVLIA